MPEVQRSDSLRSADEGEAGDLPTEVQSSLIVETHVTSSKPPERSVSFNRDVHVKRIGRGVPRVTAALAGDGEGRLIATPVHKESITSRSKEDLALEAALVLEQVENVNCVARDNRRLPDKFSTLPARRSKKRVELPLETRRRSVDIGPTTSDEAAGTPRPKKKALERSVSDASSHKSKGPLAKLFSPKLDRKLKPSTVKRSASDAGASSSSSRSQRKRSGSESESSHQNGSSRAKKPLSPIIEASPQVDKPFDFGGKSEARRAKRDAEEAVEDRAEESTVHEICVSKPPKSPRRQEVRVESTITKETATTSVRRAENKTKEEHADSRGKSSPGSPTERLIKVEVDEVDEAAAAAKTTTSVRDMLHSSRYDQQHGDGGRGEESTIHKMIHRLTADRSPPPQLTRTMVSPGPGFGHNNNRPFSYTRPNNNNNNNNETTSPSPPHQQTSVIYAQVQLDKKSKAQRSHSDSDEGLGLERKDSSRENSPAEKEYRRTTEYPSYGSDLRRNNEINSFKSSRYVEEVPLRKHVAAHFTDLSKSNNFGSRNLADTKLSRHREFDEINRNLFDKPAEKYTSTVFVDTSARGTADGMDSRRRENVERFTTGGHNGVGPTSKTSELSARRDLLESRIKSRIHTDDMFARANGNATKKIEHGIIDKPIVPSPITPDRVASPKRYTDTYISETRTNSNGERYIFEKEMHEDNGKVYGYEKKITNKIPADVASVEKKPRDGYTVETRTDKYGDKYIVETRTHEGYADGFKPFLSDKSRNSPEGRFQAARNGTTSPYKSTNYIVQEESRHPRTETVDVVGTSSPIIVKKIREHKFSKSEDFLDRDARPTRDSYVPKTKKNFESIRGISKSTQRLDEVGENSRVKALRSEYITRSHENLSTADYVNARDVRRPLASPVVKSGRKERSSTLVKRHLDELRERPNDDYDTDISQMTNSQLESSKYYKETRTTQRYTSGKRNLNDEYDSSPPRIRNGDRGGAGYNSSRYDSDTTARDSVRCEARYVEESSSRSARKDHHARKPQETDPKKPLRRSRNRLDYFDDSDARESPRGKHSKERLETFDESPTMPSRVYHESKVRHTRHESRGHVERRHRETRLSDPDRKDRLADSGIENDYRRDSQEADRREPLESEDEGFVTLQFIKHERRHTDRNMNLTPSEKRKYDKYVNGAKSQIVSAKPPSGAEKKYEKKIAKKSGTMSKVKQLFSKKEKKAKEEKSKAKGSRSGSSGALTDDEVTMRYREYRGDQLRSARSARDLESDINQTVDKKARIPESEILTTGTEDEEASSAPERVSVQKSLRFFGETDQESVSSNRERRSKRNDDNGISRRDVTSSSRQNLNVTSPPRKPPRLAESALSSGESTTGDSSQQSQNSQRSQRSVVYLHAATVGEIPGPNERRRAASRDELNRPLQSHTRTVSRSVSVLAPWKPRHYREPFEINYDQQQQQQHQKPPTTMRRRQRSRETLSRRGKEPRRSKDNISKTGTISRSTLKSKDKQKADRTVSTESLASKPRNGSSRGELSRSTSVPRDPNKGAGWFKIKSKKSRA